VHPPESPGQHLRPNHYVSADILSILQENHWSLEQPSSQQTAWATRAASLLGHFAADRAALAAILRLIFEYDAHQIIQLPESHAVLTRHGARDVIRHLALFLLEPAPLDSNRFKELVDSLKERLELRSRDLFHPIRLALTGRSGEGELDRVILLLDEAAALPFAVPVKSARVRVLEFCAALD
jgi:glutamyl-tRNA synthetase/nondiscriminating glutamyl-tRNA synthetase